jgi:hypothetical protein
MSDGADNSNQQAREQLAHLLRRYAMDPEEQAVLAEMYETGPWLVLHRMILARLENLQASLVSENDEREIRRAQGGYGEIFELRNDIVALIKPMEPASQQDEDEDGGRTKLI